MNCQVKSNTKENITSAEFSILKKYSINMAEKIIHTSNFRMYQLGEKIGYKDLKYFNNMLKEVTGMSPKKYM